MRNRGLLHDSYLANHASYMGLHDLIPQMPCVAWLLLYCLLRKKYTFCQKLTILNVILIKISKRAEIV